MITTSSNLRFGKLIYDAEKAAKDLVDPVSFRICNNSLKEITEERSQKSYRRSDQWPLKAPSLVDLVEKELGLDVRVDTGIEESFGDRLRVVSLSLEKDGKTVEGSTQIVHARTMSLSPIIQLLSSALYEVAAHPTSITKLLSNNPSDTSLITSVSKALNRLCANLYFYD